MRSGRPVGRGKVSCSCKCGRAVSQVRRVAGSKISRTNPEVAGAVIESLCAGLPATARRKVLRFLVDSIREAVSSDNERWAVTLEPGYVRFNVGQTESVVLWSSAVNVLVRGIGRLPGTTLSQGYPSAGGSRLLHVPHARVSEVLARIGGAHLQAKEQARRRPCTRVVKDAHSPGVVEYLWTRLELVGRPPVPTHYGQRSLPLPTDEAALQPRYVEGDARTIVAEAYERDPRARAACIAVHGYACAVCAVVLEDRYGEVAREFIHVHHLMPIAKIGKSHELDPVKDLRPVCPNCHAILHRQDPPLTIEAARKLVRK